MEVYKKVSDLRSHLLFLKEKNHSIGFVPTMGALHPGHLSLVRHALQENDHTVVSIFVNPTQFNNPVDLEKYPRNMHSDLEQLESAGCSTVFTPSVEDIYPGGPVSKEFTLNGLDSTMEGAHRPGHFEGVATVVERFFEIVQPDRAYFGEKDYQQLLIIKKLVELKGLGLQIIPHPIERNERGLALSSRNQRLSEEDREKALLIIQSLRKAREAIPDQSPAEIKNTVAQRFKESPLQLEYVEIANEENLRTIERWEDADHARIFIAASISGVRLIDNLSLF